MAKPKLSEVEGWKPVHDLTQGSFLVAEATNIPDFFRVYPNGWRGRTKYFYGETAWQDIQRLAFDLEMERIHAF